MHGSRANGNVMLRIMKLIGEGGGGGMRAQPQFGTNGRARCGTAFPERAVMKCRKEMRAGAIPAATCFCICVICARANRSDDAKVAAMLPRDKGN